jgi:hypothetical protein
MHKLVVATVAVLCTAAASSTPSQAAAGKSIGSTIDATASVEKVGCYRLGETGYHWYRFCFGPSFLYPHRRVCRHGTCWYR